MAVSSRAWCARRDRSGTPGDGTANWSPSLDFMALAESTVTPYLIYVPRTVALAVLVVDPRMRVEAVSDFGRMDGGITLLGPDGWLHGLLKVWHGVLFTVVDRSGIRHGFPVVHLAVVLAYAGLILCLPLLAASSPSRPLAHSRNFLRWPSGCGPRGPRLHQVFIAQTGWALDKHIALGIWLAAMARVRFRNRILASARRSSSRYGRYPLASRQLTVSSPQPALEQTSMAGQLAQLFAGFQRLAAGHSPGSSTSATVSTVRLSTRARVATGCVGTAWGTVHAPVPPGRDPPRTAYYAGNLRDILTDCRSLLTHQLLQHPAQPGREPLIWHRHAHSAEPGSRESAKSWTLRADAGC